MTKVLEITITIIIIIIIITIKRINKTKKHKDNPPPKKGTKTFIQEERKETQDPTEKIRMTPVERGSASLPAEPVGVCT